MVERHTHNGSDSHRLRAQEALVNAPQEAVTPPSGTAGATYTSNEQAILQATANSLADLITKLQTIGIIK